MTSSNVPHNVSGSLYVDDLILYSSSAHVPSIECRLQIAINRVYSWAEDHGFEFPMTRVAVHFDRKRGLLQESSLSLNGHRIIFKASTKFLDQRLNWKLHIGHLKTECQKRMNLLRCESSSMRWRADRTTMLSLYRAIIRSKIDYDCMIYGSAKEYILRTLDPVHNACIRLRTKAFRSSPISSLYVDSGEMPLSLRREQLLMQFYAGCGQLPLEPTHHCLTHSATVLSSACFMIDALLADLHLQVFDVSPVIFENLPIWNIPLEITFCQGFHCPRKSDIHPTHLLFSEHVYFVHTNHAILYTDGSKLQEQVGCAAVFAAVFAGECGETAKAQCLLLN